MSELAIVEGRAVAQRSANPEEEVEYASMCAKALMRAIDSNPQLKVAISGRDYLKVEAWQTLGAMSKIDGVQTVWCREYTPPGGDRPIGWEARVEVRDREGNVRGAGESMCLRSESTWANRDEFAIRSMAQTRAVGKAYRMALAFIVSLAGFEPSPAEEMPGYGAPAPAAPASAAAPPPSVASGEYIFPLGKHKGKPISQVPREYLEWFLANADDKPDVKAAVQAYLSPAPAPSEPDFDDVPFS